MPGESPTNLAALNDRYDRLWTKAERLVEAFLDWQLAALETISSQPTAIAADPEACHDRPLARPSKSPSRPSARTKSKELRDKANVPAPASHLPPPTSPTIAAMREIYIAVQCLKRIHEGRHAVLTGGTDDFQSVRPNDHAKAVAEDISRRIRALCEPNHSNGDDDNPL